MPEQDFLAGRLAVLTELADREIFRTAKGRRLTGRARANLAAEMESADPSASRSSPASTETRDRLVEGSIA